ncbi:hypothetical protein F0562_025463 [Nyssa sinensis]|uniref:NAB domain-containing protein n=1 Tax=Nyssa sinensis TaxID=561372 RepID=A0A5J5BGW1_9ASTE|nr:hypothetical protein F0562_025463 [Nyssa sinensis]
MMVGWGVEDFNGCGGNINRAGRQGRVPACRMMEEKKMRTEKTASNQSRLGRFCKPSWLQCIISDLDERMKILALNLPPEEDYADTFAERSEAYYRKRPQLLALLQDLYNGYISLADRYCQGLAKQQKQQHHFPSINFDECDYNDEDEDDGSTLIHVDSDAESSLSYQCPFPTCNTNERNVDMIVAELVMKSVDYHIIVNEVSMVEQGWGESWRKIELQKNLLEVLESERLILLNENARLGYRVTALVEENKGLASESLFIKRRAGELARCVLKMREDRRVCILSRKIEDLQGQIYGLEKRNKEYYEQLVLVRSRDHHQHQHQQEEEKKKKKTKKEVTTLDCFLADDEAVGSSSGSSSVSKGLDHAAAAKGGVVAGTGRKGFKLWDRIKNFDLFLPCGPHTNFTCR